MIQEKQLANLIQQGILYLYIKNSRINRHNDFSVC